MKTKFEYIQWDSTLMTGVHKIDEQHQILINMINEANDRLTENSGREIFIELVRDLISYAIYHFDTEEDLMIENNYNLDQREAHFQEHRNFSKQVSNLQEDLQQGKLVSKDYVLGFLNAWLVNHIKKTDMLLGRYLV